MAAAVVYGEGSDPPPQHVEARFVTGEHQWAYDPEIEPSFYGNVQVNPQPRTDMCRYKAVAINSEQEGRIVWSKLCKGRTLFRIPQTIVCDRTFTRDNEEAYYLDAMDAYLRGPPGDLKLQDIPLVKRTLEERLFYGFW